MIDPTLLVITGGTAVVGATAGILGCYLFLRRESLLGDMIGHATLPGVAAAFLLTGARSLGVLLAGALVAGVVAVYLLGETRRRTAVKTDTVLALVLSVAFGLGLVLLTVAQHRAGAAQAGLDRFLYGQAATMLRSDLARNLVVGGAAVATVLLLWTRWQLIAFDPWFAHTLGIPVRAYERLFAGLVVVVIVLGLQSAGVVLVSALVVAPAAAARQWTDRFGPMVSLAAVFGAGAAVAGTLLSAWRAGMPTGPAIILVAGGWVALSLALGRRGLVWAWRRHRRRLRGRRPEQLLALLGQVLRGHPEDEEYAAPFSLLVAALGWTPGEVSAALQRLAEQGLVEEAERHRWWLTQAGWARVTEGEVEDRRDG